MQESRNLIVVSSKYRNNLHIRRYGKLNLWWETLIKVQDLISKKSKVWRNTIKAVNKVNKKKKRSSNRVTHFRRMQLEMQLSPNARIRLLPETHLQYVIYCRSIRSKERDARYNLLRAQTKRSHSRTRAREPTMQETRFLNHCLELFHAKRDLHC